MAGLEGKATEVTRQALCPVDEEITTWIKYAANQVTGGNPTLRVWWVCAKCTLVVGVSASPAITTV